MCLPKKHNRLFINRVIITFFWLICYRKQKYWIYILYLWWFKFHYLSLLNKLVDKLDPVIDVWKKNLNKAIFLIYYYKYWHYFFLNCREEICGSQLADINEAKNIWWVWNSKYIVHFIHTYLEFYFIYDECHCGLNSLYVSEVF